MKIKAGKYTLALTFIVCGILMLINTVYGNNIFQDLWMYSPAILILYGLEIILLSVLYRKREDVRVTASIGSIILIIIAVVIFMTWTNTVEIHDPIFDNIFTIQLKV